MPSELKELTVFISSPSDKSRERKALIEDVIPKINKSLRKTVNATIRHIAWETDVVPRFGQAPQDTINEQVGTEYDIFLGIMGARFGTPTREYRSGTEEEFQRAFNRKQKGSNVEIMFYFQKPGFSGEEIEASELQKVQDFKKRISPLGVYKDYEQPDDLHSFVEEHLSTIAIEICTKTSTKNEPSILSEDKNPKMTLLEALNEIEQSEETDSFNVVEDFEDKTTKMIDKLGIITSAVELMSLRMENETDQITKAAEKSDIKAGRQSLDNVSTIWEEFVSVSSRNLSDLEILMSEQITLSSEIVEDLPIVSSPEEIESVRTSLGELVDTCFGVEASFAEVLQSAKNFPRTTSKANKSKRKLILVFQEISKILTSYTLEMDEVLNKLDKKFG